MEKIFPLVERGECLAPAMSVMGFQGATPPLLLWQTCAVEVFYGGILWDGLQLFCHKHVPIQRTSCYLHPVIHKALG